MSWGSAPITAIDRGTLEVFLDEKIGGTVHMAVGHSYPESGGVNESAVHTDLVCDLRLGGRIVVDGEDFQVDGKFVVLSDDVVQLHGGGVTRSGSASRPAG